MTVFPASILRPAGRASVSLRSPPLPPLETALVGITTLHLCFLPWALGTMHEWSQWTSLGLATVGFILALLPREKAPDFNPESSPPGPLERLRRFPVFWAGLLTLLYLAGQGCNPAWRYVSTVDAWWLVPVAHISWLPSGIAAPFALSNPWRALVICAAVWLLVCSVWVGFTRRQSYRMMFSILAANAGALAVLGGLQLLTGATEIFWSYSPSNPSFSASFIYPNHAGAYFNLLTAVAVGLAWWHYRRARHGVERPGSARVFLLLAALSGGMVVLSSSRMSIAVLVVFGGLLTGTLALQLGQHRGPARARARFLPLGLALTGLLGVCVLSLYSPRVRARFATFIADPVSVSQDRTLARQAAGEMWRDRWFWGWGAGAFRHAFPLYAQKYPLLYDGPEGERRYWEHAHDDLLEFPLELGVAGLLPLATALGWGVWQLGRQCFWRNPFALCLVAAASLTVVHGGVDFVFQNPAVLGTWSVLLIGALRWIALDEAPRPPRPVTAQTECIPAPAAASPP